MLTNTHVKKICCVFVAISLLGSLLLSSGCSRLQQTSRPTIQASPSPTETKSPAPGEPYSLGDSKFASQQEFVDKIRPRCATQEPAPAQRVAINNRIAAQRAAVPQE